MTMRLIEGGKIVGIIFKERAFPVGGLKGTPMVMPPVAMVTEADVFDGGVRWGGTNGNYQVLRTLGHGDAATVTPSLFDIMLILINLCGVGMSQCHIVRYGSEVGGGECEQGVVKMK